MARNVAEILIARYAIETSDYGFPFKGRFISLSEGAPAYAVLAMEFVKCEYLLTIAIKRGDVDTAIELALRVGYLTFDLLATAMTGKRLPEELRSYRARITASRKGGSREPVWAPVADLARSIFAKYSSGEGVSDSEALKRTRAELVLLAPKLRVTVPSLTCLREHLVNKPSSGK